MAEGRISKAERRYLVPAVLYGWRIYHPKGDSRGYWDDDKHMPVAIGPVCEGLVNKGILQVYRDVYSDTYRATDLANKFRCREPGCYRGERYDDNDYPVGKCEVCSGTGIVLATA